MKDLDLIARRIILIMTTTRVIQITIIVRTITILPITLGIINQATNQITGHRIINQTTGQIINRVAISRTIGQIINRAIKPIIGRIISHHQMITNQEEITNRKIINRATISRTIGQIINLVIKAIIGRIISNRQMTTNQEEITNRNNNTPQILQLIIKINLTIIILIGIEDLKMVLHHQIVIIVPQTPKIIRIRIHLFHGLLTILINDQNK